MKPTGFVATTLVLCLAGTQAPAHGLAAQAAPKTAPAKAGPAPKKVPAAEVDGLMAPVALYPDQLLAQMLMAATIPPRVAELDKWLKTKPPFKGTALQDAAKQQGFEPSLVSLVLFPQVVDFMAVNLDWTTEVGQAFTADRGGVLDSVQRLRADALKKGTLKSSPQQDVSLKTTEGGQQVIVIEPANPQVVYVPQYSSETVYTTAPTTTVVIQEESHDNSAAIAAGVIGFTAGIAIGAAMDNDYYYGPYGWHGGPYMYNDAWNDYYDDRQDAREDWYDNREDAREDVLDHREDMAENRGDRASSTQQQRTERQQTRQETGTTAQGARTGNASTTGASAATQSAGRTSSGQATTRSTAQPTTQSASASGQPRATGTSSQEARGTDRGRSTTAAERSGTSSDAFSGYSSGKSERSASARGQQSRSSGGRSSGGGGGGGRRR